MRVECGIAPQPFTKHQYSNIFHSLTELNSNKKCTCSHHRVTYRYTNSLNQVPSISVVRPIHSDMMKKGEKIRCVSVVECLETQCFLYHRYLHADRLATMSYRAGIIGTGGIAGMGILGMHDEETIGNEKVRASHAGGYNAVDDLDLVAIADIDEERLDTFGEAWDITEESRYVGHDSMLAAEDLDVVSVCTPSFLHHEHVVDAATSDADPDVIWCEKPIASQVSAAEEMIDVCNRTDTELLVNHSFRFTEDLQALHRLIQEEEILGDIHSVSAQFRMELFRNSTHLLDTLVYLLDARADSVNGYINV